VIPKLVPPKLTITNYTDTPRLRFQMVCAMCGASIADEEVNVDKLSDATVERDSVALAERHAETYRHHFRLMHGQKGSH